MILLWSTHALGDLVQHYAHSCEDCGDLRTLRLGHLPGRLDEEDPEAPCLGHTSALNRLLYSRSDVLANQTSQVLSKA